MESEIRKRTINSDSFSPSLKKGQTEEEYYQKKIEKLQKIYDRLQEDNDSRLGVRIYNGLQSVFWLAAACAAIYYTDFLVAIQVDPRIDRFWFNIGAILISINITIGVFFVVLCSYLWKIKSEDWEKRYPHLIPIATAAFLCGSVCCIVGLWPVWGILTPFILGTIFMGVVVCISYLPSFM